MLLGDPFVQVLALKLGKLASEQFGIALNILPMAQNFGSPEVNHRRHLTEMAHNCPSDGEWRVPIGNSAERPYKKTPLRPGLEVDDETLEVSCLTFQPNTQR